MIAFMQPAIEFGTFIVGETTEGTVVLHPDVFETEKKRCKLLRSERWRKKQGWFGRLSAPGFFDCTDWSGPFDSEKEAKEFLSDMYDGEPLEDDIE